MLTDERLRQLWARVSATTLTTQIHDAMRAVEAEARREALEEAAALAIERTKKYVDFTCNWHVAADCAAAIRALTDHPRG